MGPALTVALASVMTACMTTSSGSRPPPKAPEPRRSSFPAPAELERAKAASDVDAALGRGLTPTTWTFEGPLPGFGKPTAAAYPPEWIAARHEIERRDGAIHSTAMQCVAREVARFHVRNGEGPSAYFLEELALRCGTTAGNPGYHFLQWKDVGAFSADRLRASAAEEVAQVVERLPRGDGLEVGLAFHHGGAAAVAIVAHGTREADIAQIDLEPGLVTFSGRLLREAADIDAVVTQGDRGYAECSRDERWALPDFTIQCPFPPDDGVVRIDVSAREEGRYLGQTFLQLDLPVRGSLSPHFEEISSEGAPEPTPEEIVRAVNAIRFTGGLSPVRLESAQSQTSRQVAPAYFSALRGVTDRDAADVVAMGLQAGYDVESAIRFAYFGSFFVHAGPNATALVRRASRRPWIRQIFLHPEVDRLAVGALADPGAGTVGIMATSYVGPPDLTRDELRAEVFDRLVQARAFRDRPPPQRVTFGRQPEEVQGWLDELESGQASVAWVAHAMLTRATSHNRGRRFESYTLETSRLEELEFPKSVLEADALQLEVEVALFQPLGEPWVRYAVLLVYPSAGVLAAREPEGSAGSARLARR